MMQLQILFEQYKDYLGIVLISLVISFILTPLTGVIAFKIGALDMPARLRDRNDKTKERKIHQNIMPRLGGLAIAIAVMLMIVLNYSNITAAGDYQKTIQLIIGIILIVALGFFDSVAEMPAAEQLLIQIIAALLITSSGIKITDINLGTNIRLDAINFQIHLSNLTLYIAPIADFISVIWIVAIINAMNWVSGIDGLGSALGAGASLTLLFISVKFSSVFPAIIAAALGGAVIGFFPFNFPPAKTYSGSIGDMLQGYLLAILAILSPAKLTTSLILLALPIIDAIWVLGGRFFRHRKELKSPLDILKISDKTHLHHRLLDLGFSVRQTLAIEMLVFLFFCIVAYYFAGFDQQVILLLITIFIFLCLFVVIALVRSRSIKRREALKQTTESKKSVKILTETPEEKYAY